MAFFCLAKITSPTAPLSLAPLSTSSVLFISSFSRHCLRGLLSRGPLYVFARSRPYCVRCEPTARAFYAARGLAKPASPIRGALSSVPTFSVCASASVSVISRVRHQRGAACRKRNFRITLFGIQRHVCIRASSSLSHSIPVCAAQRYPRRGKSEALIATPQSSSDRKIIKNNNDVRKKNSVFRGSLLFSVGPHPLLIVPPRCASR